MNPETAGTSAAPVAPVQGVPPAVADQAPTAAPPEASTTPPPTDAATAPPPADGAAAMPPASGDAAGAAPVGDAAAPAASAPADAATTAAVPPVPAEQAAGLPVEQAVQAAHGDHSLLGLVLQAGPVVQGVMGALVLASVISWAIMIEKAMVLGKVQREIRRLAEAGEPDAAHNDGLAAGIQRAAAREWSEGRDYGESRSEYRERIERAMRETLNGALRRAQTGTAFLATTGAIAPFVGLFGTVWGIMGSFQGIAASRDTSLAVVAPGIAEALLATAIGLFAAIPAVIGYNRIGRRVAGLRADGLAAISSIGARLSARPPRGGQARAAE